MGYTKTTFDKEANIMYHDVHIDDYNYFSMIDNQIRSEYTLCEEFTLLPKILKLYKDNEISSEENDLESPRVAMLGQKLDTPMHYHWILDHDKVTEKWAAGVITLLSEKASCFSVG